MRLDQSSTTFRKFILIISSLIAGAEQSTQTSGIGKCTRTSGVGKCTWTSGVRKGTQTSSIGKCTRTSGVGKGTKTSSIGKCTQTSSIEKCTQTSGVGKILSMIINQSELVLVFNPEFLKSLQGEFFNYFKRKMLIWCTSEIFSDRNMPDQLDGSSR